MELSEYLHNFRARWKTIVITIIVCVLASLGISAVLPQKFTATALVFVTTDSPKSSSYENSQFSLQRVKSYPSLADSPDVLNPVISELGLTSSAVELASRITATNPANTVYVQVSATASKPSLANQLANSVAKQLVVKIKSVEVASRASGTTVQPVVAVPAVTPNNAIFPNTKINVALGLLIGLALGMLLAMLRIRLDKRVYDAADVLAATGLPLVGHIPKEVHFQKTKMYKDTRRETVDPFLALWTNIAQNSENGPPTLLVLAPATHKSAAQSAAFRRGGVNSLADYGQNVCYVESDSSVPTSFNEFEAEPGISEVLESDLSVKETFRRIKGRTITVVPSGVANNPLSPSNPVHKGKPGQHNAQDNAPEKTSAVFAELQDSFDVVVVQGSSSIAGLNVKTLAPLASSVVIVGIYGHSTAVALRQTTLELKAQGVRAVGVVLLETPLRILRQSNDDQNAAPWTVS